MYDYLGILFKLTNEGVVMQVFKRSLRILCLSSSMLAAGVAMAAGPNLITNGGFSDGLNGWTEIVPDAHYGNVNYQGRYLDNPCGGVATPSANGCGGDNYGLSTLSGKYASDTASSSKGIYQTVTGLVVGDTYSLSFFQTGSDYRWAGEIQWWQVTLGRDVQNGAAWRVEPGSDNYLWNNNWDRTSATGDSINANFRWTRSALTFVATATSERLTFKQQQNPASDWDTSVTPYGTPMVFLIDGITLQDISTSPVPEPSAASLSLLGLTAIGFMVSRRRRTGR